MAIAFALLFSLGNPIMNPRLNPKADAAPPYFVYLPLVLTSPPPGTQTRVNAPYFNTSPAGNTSLFGQTAIFWFGKVDLSSNYADVRVAFTPSSLWVYAAIFDHRLVYDTSPNPADLTNWDAVTLYLDKAGNTARKLDANAYRFDAQLNFLQSENRANYQAAYQGGPNGWSLSGVNFSTISGYMGANPNSGQNSVGWGVSFDIPYASLGLSGPPANGNVWGIAMVLHDRDSAPPAAMQPDEAWPEGLSTSQPSTWAQLNRGMPAYTPPAVQVSGSTKIREGLNGVHVPDAGVGGQLDYLCPPDDQDSTWQNWGNHNSAGNTGLNIANQENLADWPCYAKYYVTFPLNPVPAGKSILKATLTLHQWGYAGDLSTNLPSYIQVFTVADDWNESTITWNNAPQALENVSATWVITPSNIGTMDWPKAPVTWDVTRAVAEAYASGQPLRLALYESDANYHSGKYFSSSNAEVWNAAGRPTLDVDWGN
jgi:hypothetical protein